MCSFPSVPPALSSTAHLYTLPVDFSIFFAANSHLQCQIPWDGSPFLWRSSFSIAHFAPLPPSAPILHLNFPLLTKRLRPCSFPASPVRVLAAAQNTTCIPSRLCIPALGAHNVPAA
ncbi:hypothetical protein TRVL_06770 [Trypanosoma vivax]|nr:hypothetical protein TRVL_06770 [Trypanosoma vivax]